MDDQERIKAFLAGSPHAVIGASPNREKYGNKVLRTYLQRQMPVYCVHPSQDVIEGVPCHRSLAELPEKPHGVSIITPHQVTERIVEECATLGIRHLWMQPGAESEAALTRAAELGLDVIAGGPCLLVALRFKEQG